MLVVDNSPEVIVLPVTRTFSFRPVMITITVVKCHICQSPSIHFFFYCHWAAGILYCHCKLSSRDSSHTILLSIVSAREGVPFPVVVEVLLLELAFELLREAGIRLPGQLGGTIGIVGGLIVGQAAVDANIVSTIVVIVVAFTAIASFFIPK